MQKTERAATRGPLFRNCDSQDYRRATTTLSADSATSRIGTPEQHPQFYAQASPNSHVDRLERPLLVLHGTADVNVPYLHSVRLIDALLKQKKGSLVEFMTYPGEFHYFTREHVLKDAWTRVDRFFARWLTPARASASQ